MRLRETLRDLLGLSLNSEADALTHLQGTLSWLCRAQDVAGNGGVARMYDLRTGWGAAYPETTGYIIPTFLAYARHTGDDAYRQRALRMADWEIDVQMESGAVQGGTVDCAPTPAIFNTGQVIFGWTAAFRETSEPRYRAACVRAAEFLVEAQDADGLWRRHLSNFCSAPSDHYAYNVRTAWALLKAADCIGANHFRAAGEANLRAVAERANVRGWIPDNCLSDPEQPLLHTIGYTLQGLLEGAQALNDDRMFDLVVRGSDELRRCFTRHGQLYGRYDAQWRPTVSWRCLTGEAQCAVVWHRLAELLGDHGWRRTAIDLAAAVSRTQQLSGPLEIRGGVKGAFPLYGRYGEYQYLNWAAKFHADALMLELDVADAAIHG